MAPLHLQARFRVRPALQTPLARSWLTFRASPRPTSLLGLVLQLRGCSPSNYSVKMTSLQGCLPLPCYELLGGGGAQGMVLFICLPGA